MKKIKVNKKTWLLAGISGFIIIAALLFQLGMAIAKWFDANKIIKQQVISLQVQTPFRIENREPQTQEIVQVIEKMPEYKDLTDIEKYICDKWGQFDCKVALAIAKSESGLREDAFNTYNTNGTLDVGIFQINSIHFSKEGCSLKELVDAKKNVDCAYKIYEASGWNAWVVYQTGSFKNKL